MKYTDACDSSRYHDDYAMHQLVFPADAQVDGRTLDQWTAYWWTSVMQSPAEQNIVVDPDGRFAELGDTGKVLVLGGLFRTADENGDLGTVQRVIHVGQDEAVLVPVLNFFDLEGPELQSPPDFVGTLNRFMDNWAQSIDTEHTHLYVDGKEVDLTSHFHRTEVFSMGTAENGTLITSLGVPEGMQMDYTMAEGYMVMLYPLTKGVHELVWEGTTHALPDDGGATLDGTNEFHYRVEDHLIVG